MKKIIGIVIIVICALTITYRLMNQAPDEHLSADEQVLAILESGGCAMCHAQSPELPFYAEFPIIGNQVKEDALLAGRELDITNAITALQNGEKVDEISLNKIEKSIHDGTMPIAKFYLVHWGSSINRTEREMILNWAKEHRAKHYANGLACAKFANEPVSPLPDSIAVDLAKVALGKLLYNDVRLSSDNTISCASCHDLAKGGTDNEDVSDGVGGKVGGINAPTVFNSWYNFVQFWDGRAATLAEQAAGPPVNPVEMACKDWKEIELKLQADEEFNALFTLVYPTGITEKNITNAIEEYEKTLLTPNSPFDRYLKGDTNAMCETQIVGYELFKKHNCATCHGGINLGGISYDYMGLKADYFADRGTELTEEDYGRGKQEESIYYDHRFKTPGLRNVALTFPYFHDASQKDLYEAVNAMMKYQVGAVLTEDETTSIVAFLESLTGDIPSK